MARFTVPAAATVIVSALLAPAQAQALTGIELVAKCRSGTDQDRAWCEGYVQGAAQGFANAWRFSTGAEMFCIPIDTPSAVLPAMIAHWLDEYPDKAFLDAEVVVVGALRESYPC